MKIEELRSILNSVYKHFSIIKSPEITLEANPNDLTREKIKKLISIGINRISLGGQSFNDKHLRILNRSHTAKETLNSIEIMQNEGLENISLDLMYGFPGLDNKDWSKNLMTAISLNIPHLSCYCLTVEKGTAFYHMVKTKKITIDEDRKIKSQFLMMRKILMSNNYKHYEISNFSKPNYESLHNLGYWNGKKYLGVGPSSHSYDGKSRQWNIKSNNKYIIALKEDEIYFQEEVLTKKNIINEYILTGLRTTKGVSLKKLHKNMNASQRSNLFECIKSFKKRGLIKIEENIFFLTEQGMLFCDKITSDLFLI